jgi:hypothetical protein
MKGRDSDVGIRRLLFCIWMVVDNSCRHGNHDGPLLLHDEETHGVYGVRAPVSNVGRLPL